jgi:predicted DNA-binding transcriptional regulator AlpA
VVFDLLAINKPDRQLTNVLGYFPSLEILLNQSKLDCIVRSMDKPDDLISTTQAIRLIGISTATMARLIKDKTIQTYSNPFDKREKLVSKAELLSLKPKRAEAA